MAQIPQTPIVDLAKLKGDLWSIFAPELVAILMDPVRHSDMSLLSKQ